MNYSGSMGLVGAPSFSQAATAFQGNGGAVLLDDGKSVACFFGPPGVANNMTIGGTEVRWWTEKKPPGEGSTCIEKELAHLSMRLPSHYQRSLRPKQRRSLGRIWWPVAGPSHQSAAMAKYHHLDVAVPWTAFRCKYSRTRTPVHHSPLQLLMNRHLTDFSGASPLDKTRQARSLDTRSLSPARLCADSGLTKIKPEPMMKRSLRGLWKTDRENARWPKDGRLC